MFNLKPHKIYEKSMSEEKQIMKLANNIITVQEYYGKCNTLKINIWNKKDEIYVLKFSKNIPLNLYAFYILYIYKHLGICHKDLRSKFYIGKAREDKEENLNDRITKRMSDM